MKTAFPVPVSCTTLAVLGAGKRALTIGAGILSALAAIAVLVQLHRSDTVFRERIAEAVENRAELFTGQVMAATSVALAVADVAMAIRSSAAGLTVPPDLRLPIKCDDVGLNDRASLSSPVAGMFGKGEYSDGDLACLSFAMKTALASHRHGGLSRLSLHALDRVVQVPYADAARPLNDQIAARSAHWSKLEAVPSDAQAFDSFLIPPSAQFSSADKRLGVAVLVGTSPAHETAIFVDFAEDVWSALVRPLSEFSTSISIVNDQGGFLSETDSSGLDLQVPRSDVRRLAEDATRSAVHHNGKILVAARLPAGWYVLASTSASDVHVRVAAENWAILAVSVLMSILAWVARHLLVSRIIIPCERQADETGRQGRTFTLMAEALPGAACLIRPDGSLASCNANMLALLGFAADSAPVDLGTIRDHPTLRAVESLVWACASKEHRVGPVRVPLPDGRSMEARLQTDPVTALSYLLLDDVTERLMSERLERTTRAEVQEALDRLADAKERLVETEKISALTRLVSGVSHEVNTPLGTAATGLSELGRTLAVVRSQSASGELTRTLFTRFIEDADMLVRVAGSSVERAIALVQGFKRIAVDHSLDERQMVDLSAWMGEVMPALQIEAAKSGHTLTFTGLEQIYVEANPLHLWQIVSNLVGNAILHAFVPGQAGTITLTIAADDGSALISVRDNGVGVPPDILRQIFEPFFTTKRGAGGTGLGLSIVHNLVHQGLKGEITVTSCRHGSASGTTMTIRLPQARAGAACSPAGIST